MTSTRLIFAALALFVSIQLFSCNTSKKTFSMDDVLNKTWVLSSLNGNKVDSSTFLNGYPSIVFGNEGKLNGSTGCNRFSGTYKNEGGKYNLDPGAMTRMYCPGNGESEFVTTLEECSKLEIRNNQLILLNQTMKELMIFTSENK